MNSPRICFNALFLSTCLLAAISGAGLAQKDFTLEDGAVVKLKLMRDLFANGALPQSGRAS